MNAPICESVLLPFVADVLARFDANQAEFYAERAAIIEFQADQPRALSECLAVVETLKRWPSLLSGLTSLEIKRAGIRNWLLTSDLVLARQVVHQRGAVEIAVFDPLIVLRERYGGVAMLGAVGAMSYEPGVKHRQ